MTNLVRSTELRNLMMSWRRRLRPEQIPGFVRAQRRKTVSQEEMARLTGVTTPWYGALERGCLDRVFSPDFLDRVAYSLRLSTGERRVLYLLARGHEPAPRPYAPPAISPAVQASLEQQPWPAYICDATWEILAANDAMREWFPHIEWESNLQRWVFCYPESRMQLVDWEDTHARVMLAQLRAQLARMPSHLGLQRLIAEILSTNAVAKRLWDKEPAVWMHDDGDRYGLFLSWADEPTTVETVSWVPQRNPDLRVKMLIPVAGHIPRGCKGAFRAFQT